MSSELKAQAGVAKIGRSGRKLHSAVKYATGYIVITCGCPGTQNGSAANKAQFFAHGTQTCQVQK